ncbi:MAG TPA: HdeD family acid-resistance protein [Fimbriimonadaceae bacterium]|nr:HdeD family acid-resistance protein [Fimbriimonadaceae bacterium]
MCNGLKDRWWLFVVRGLLAILFGALAFARPEIAFAALIAIFGGYALADGFLSLAGCLALTGARSRWWLLIEGVFGIAAGVITFTNPGATAFVLLALLGAWLILSGVIRIVLAFELRDAIRGEWLLGAAGLCSIIAGLLTLISPVQTAFAWMWVMGLYAIVAGIAMLCLGFRLRSLSNLGALTDLPSPERARPNHLGGTTR